MQGLTTHQGTCRQGEQTGKQDSSSGWQHVSSCNTSSSHGRTDHRPAHKHFLAGARRACSWHTANNTAAPAGAQRSVGREIGAPIPHRSPAHSPGGARSGAHPHAGAARTDLAGQGHTALQGCDGGHFCQSVLRLGRGERAKRRDARTSRPGESLLSWPRRMAMAGPPDCAHAHCNRIYSRGHRQWLWGRTHSLQTCCSSALAAPSAHPAAPPPRCAVYEAIVRLGKAIQRHTCGHPPSPS